MATLGNKGDISTKVNKIQILEIPNNSMGIQGTAVFNISLPGTIEVKNGCVRGRQLRPSVS